MDRTPIETKIALLLARAERTNAAEAEALTAAAERLMIRHGIERAMLTAAGTVPDEPIEIRVVQIRGVYKMKMVDLLTAVVLGAGGDGSLQTNRNARVVRGAIIARIVGRRSDVADAEALFRSLERQALSAARAFWKSHPYNNAYDRAYGPAERREFLGAFAAGVLARLNSARTAAHAEAGGGAELVLASRGAQVERFYADAFPNLRTARRSSAQRGSSAAYERGHQAGRTADVGERRLAGRGALAGAGASAR